MKKKWLNRVNMALGAAICSLIGCSPVEPLMKYGCPEVEVMYGVMPEVVDTVPQSGEDTMINPE